ncbi:hypothetical protein Ccrd_014551 [Cynara cardunculus var. scolymus]|uniref:Uncharacterized protein n=1 Tax=Cynara cardunculus var. scolymus TaxID=59895 RepID=A0A103YDG3_CYNCS|nr:hypothetical protein Ccrd_014551 [Cynara cardunculus var. scolymus]
MHFLMHLQASATLFESTYKSSGCSKRLLNTFSSFYIQLVSPLVSYAGENLEAIYRGSRFHPPCEIRRACDQRRVSDRRWGYGGGPEVKELGEGLMRGKEPYIGGVSEKGALSKKIEGIDAKRADPLTPHGVIVFQENDFLNPVCLSFFRRLSSASLTFGSGNTASVGSSRCRTSDLRATLTCFSTFSSPFFAMGSVSFMVWFALLMGSDLTLLLSPPPRMDEKAVARATTKFGFVRAGTMSARAAGDGLWYISDEDPAIVIEFPAILSLSLSLSLSFPVLSLFYHMVCGLVVILSCLQSLVLNLF